MWFLVGLSSSWFGNIELGVTTEACIPHIPGLSYVLVPKPPISGCTRLCKMYHYFDMNRPPTAVPKIYHSLLDASRMSRCTVYSYLFLVCLTQTFHTRFFQRYTTQDSSLYGMESILEYRVAHSRVRSSTEYSCLQIYYADLIGRLFPIEPTCVHREGGLMGLNPAKVAH